MEDEAVSRNALVGARVTYLNQQASVNAIIVAISNQKFNDITVFVEKIQK